MQDEKGNNSTGAGETGEAAPGQAPPDAAWVRDFYRLATSYWAAGALLAAVRLRLFDALAEGPADAAATARKLQVEPRWSAKLLEACAALGLMEKNGAQFANTATAAALLVRTSPYYQGDLILHLGDQWSRFGELDFTVRTGRPGPLTAVQQDARTEQEQRELDRIWVRAMHNIAAAGQARALAEALDLGDRRQLLDVGCGPGTYSVALCRRNPQLHAVAFDLPEIIPLAEELISRSEVAERVTTRAGSFIHDAYGSGYDVVLFSGVLHGVDEAGCLKVLRRAYNSMAGGGLLVIQEMLLAEGEAGPLLPALFSLNMMRGASYRGSQLKEWATQSGFTRAAVHPLPGATWLDSLVIAHKG